MDLSTDVETVVNDVGVDKDVDAASIIKGFIKEQYLAVFDTVDEVRAFVGGEPVINKLGLVKKEKINPVTKLCR